MSWIHFFSSIANAAQELGGTTAPTQTTATISSFLSETYPRLIRITAALAVLAIAYWGLRYITTGAWGIKSTSKDRLTAAFWGLLLALASWLILETINPQINQALNNFLSNLQ